MLRQVSGQYRSVATKANAISSNVDGNWCMDVSTGIELPGRDEENELFSQLAVRTLFILILSRTRRGKVKDKISVLILLAIPRYRTRWHCVGANLLAERLTKHRNRGTFAGLQLRQSEMNNVKPGSIALRPGPDLPSGQYHP